MIKIMSAIAWTEAAETRLKEIPFFVRPAARKKIEKFAQEAGITEITETVYEEAKQKFNKRKS
ncbi:MAG: PCP reductase family protein [Microcystaceae cyanobacterium]